jgi:predicted transcriptional regulator
MKTQNITLAISKEVLSKARRLAVERHTSLSALVTQMILDLVDQDDSYRAARDRQLALLAQGLNLDTQGAATWTREELHER